MACSVWWWAFCEVSSAGKVSERCPIVELTLAARLFAPGGGHFFQWCSCRLESCRNSRCARS
ncbi:unnamed protein product [Ectocarpus fasciculatus]